MAVIQGYVSFCYNNPNNTGLPKTPNNPCLIRMPTSSTRCLRHRLRVPVFGPVSAYWYAVYCTVYVTSRTPFLTKQWRHCQQRPSGRHWDYGAIKGSPWLVERFPRGPWTSRIGREKKCQLINEYYWELRTQFLVLFRHVLLDKFQNNRKFWVFCQSYNTPDDERQNITSHCHGFHFYRDKPANDVYSTLMEGNIH